MERIKKKVIESHNRLKESGEKFRKELFNSTNTAIVAAFGFLIALAWKDVITEAVSKIEQLSPMSGKLISALLITIVCVVGILISTKLLSDEITENGPVKIAE